MFLQSNLVSFYHYLQLGLFLKKILKGDIGSLSKNEFIEAISQYLRQRASLASSDFSKFCICGGKRETIQHTVSSSSGHTEVIDLHQKQLEVWMSAHQKFTPLVFLSTTIYLYYIICFCLYWHDCYFQDLRFYYKEMRRQVKQIQADWEEEVSRLGQNTKISNNIQWIFLVYLEWFVRPLNILILCLRTTYQGSWSSIIFLSPSFRGKSPALQSSTRP